MRLSSKWRRPRFCDHSTFRDYGRSLGRGAPWRPAAEASPSRAGLPAQTHDTQTATASVHVRARGALLSDIWPGSIETDQPRTGQWVCQYTRSVKANVGKLVLYDEVLAGFCVDQAA